MTANGDRPIDDFRWLSGTLKQLGRAPSRARPRRVYTKVSPGRVISAIRWGDAPVEVVYLHGGGQNAHTWDLVAALVAAPGIAIDLPGHGHSSWREDKDYRPQTHAHEVAAALENWATHPDVVVGMSQGGLTSIALAGMAPALVPEMVLVDILPKPEGSPPGYDRFKLGQVALVDGPRTFGSLEEMVLAAAAVTPPSRPLDTLRRGVWHNATQLEGGAWQWRYDDLGASRTFDQDDLWDILEQSPAPLTVVKGGTSPLLDEATLARLAAARPDAVIVVAQNAGHAVQSDEPVLLAEIIRARLDAAAVR